MTSDTTGYEEIAGFFDLITESMKRASITAPTDGPSPEDLERVFDLWPDEEQP